MKDNIQIEPVDLCELEATKGGYNYAGCMIVNGKCSGEGGCGITNGKCKDGEDDKDTGEEEEQPEKP